MYWTIIILSITARHLTLRTGVQQQCCRIVDHPDLGCCAVGHGYRQMV